jgi:hypothetical protein
VGEGTSLLTRLDELPMSIPFPLSAFIRSAMLPIEDTSGPFEMVLAGAGRSVAVAAGGGPRVEGAVEDGSPLLGAQ